MVRSSWQSSSSASKDISSVPLPSRNSFHSMRKHFDSFLQHGSAGDESVTASHLVLCWLSARFDVSRLRYEYEATMTRGKRAFVARLTDALRPYQRSLPESVNINILLLWTYVV